MPRSTLPSLRLLLLVLALVVTARGPVAAQSDATASAGEAPASPTILFRPADEGAGAFFDLDLDPGDSQTLEVLLGNPGVEPIEARTYAADAYTLTNGGFGLREAGTERTGPTTWLDYPEEVLTIPPGEGIVREFTITVPDDAEPGEHMTGLAMETTEAARAEGQATFQFAQILRTVLAIRVTVPGPTAPALELGGVSIQYDPGVTSLVVEVRNTGNVLLNPAGEIAIVDGAGNAVLTAPVQMGTVYAWHDTTIRLGLTGLLPAGDYLVSVGLRDEATGVAASVTDVPVTLAGDATPSAKPVAFVSATATPRPSADELQFLEVTAVIANTGEPLTNARLTLHATRDGEPVEDFALASSLALPTGETEVQNRYIPAEGWSAGRWEFTLTLEAVDPATGAARVIDTVTLGEPVVIP